MNDWVVTLKFKNMPEDADVDSMTTFTNVLLDNNYDENVFSDIEILKIERVKE